jgi:hypothetical protein
MASRQAQCGKLAAANFSFVENCSWARGQIVDVAIGISTDVPPDERSLAMFQLRWAAEAFFENESGFWPVHEVGSRWFLAR